MIPARETYFARRESEYFNVSEENILALRVMTQAGRALAYASVSLEILFFRNNKISRLKISGYQDKTNGTILYVGFGHARTLRHMALQAYLVSKVALSCFYKVYIYFASYFKGTLFIVSLVFFEENFKQPFKFFYQVSLNLIYLLYTQTLYL